MTKKPSKHTTAKEEMEEVQEKKGEREEGKEDSLGGPGMYCNQILTWQDLGYVFPLFTLPCFLPNF